MWCLAPPPQKAIWKLIFDHTVLNMVMYVARWKNGSLVLVYNIHPQVLELKMGGKKWVLYLNYKGK